MPQYSRIPHKFQCRGVGLRYAPDLMPEGYYPALNNVEANAIGVLQVRPGILPLNGIFYPDAIHSIRRLQDLTNSTDTLLIGSGTSLYNELSATALDSGYSGNPLSMVPMRPPQSPRPWMYVADSLRMRKFPTSGANYGVGIAPPTVPAGFTRGGPFQSVIDDFESVTGWADAGTTTIGAATARFAETIEAILYDSGSNGWATIAVTSGGTPSYQAGARALLTNGATTEFVEMREIYPAFGDPSISPVTITGILYDSGSTGLCSITLSNLPTEFIGLVPNRMIRLGGTTEFARVLSVALGLDGTASLRCSTVNTHIVGDTVEGMMSFRALTVNTFIATNTITGNYVPSTTTVGAGWLYADLTAGPLDISSFNGRSIQPEDYIHISLKVDVPANLTSLRLYFNVAPTFPAFPTVVSAYYYDVDVSLLNDSWQEVFFNVSELQSTGIGISEVLNLSAVTGIILSFVTSGTAIVSADSWWIGGTFGPDSTNQTPYTIYYRYRSSLTGAISNPSPGTPAPLDLRREQGLITPTISADPQVDKIDLFAIGASLTQPRLIGTMPNAAIQFGFDSTNASNAVNEVLSFTNFQPFPVSDLPKRGVVNVSGTLVQWVSGDLFNTSWQAGSQIIINSNVYTLAAPPASTTLLTILENAGTFGTATIDPAIIFIPEATLGGQPLAFIWGPDPLTNVMFGVGTDLAAGVLFWTNPGDPDSASDANVYEVCSPSEPLLGGFMYNGSSYVWSIQKLYRAIAQSQIDPITGVQSVTYRTQEVPNFKGLFSPHAFCVGDAYWQVTSDGIYESQGGVPRSITDDSLYPLFTHDGKSGSVSYGYRPIDFTFPDKIRLHYTKAALYFIFQDDLGDTACWKYDRTLPNPGWFGVKYNTPFPWVIYGDELEGSVAVYMGGNTNQIYSLGIGTDDDGSPIVFNFNTPAFDGGDPRSQKLLLDYMIDYNPVIATITSEVYGNNLQTLINSTVLTTGSDRLQTPVNAIQAGLPLYRNVGLYISGTTSFGRPLFYEFEPNFLLQPYVAVNFSNQYQTHQFTNYGHIRDGWIMYISTSALTFTITADGGTPYTFSIPSSAGLPKKVYLFDSTITPPTAAAFVRKGKIFLYSVTSESAFALFTDETIINAKEWGSTGPYLPFKPFVGQTA